MIVVENPNFLLLENFIREKSFPYCTNVHSYFEKGNKFISTYKSQCFKVIQKNMVPYNYMKNNILNKNSKFQLLIWQIKIYIPQITTWLNFSLQTNR